MSINKLPIKFQTLGIGIFYFPAVFFGLSYGEEKENESGGNSRQNRICEYTILLSNNFLIIFLYNVWYDFFAVPIFQVIR